MIYRLTIGRWKFTFSMAPTTTVVGVNSTLPDGSHILMWDFDETTLGAVITALEATQAIYELPNIYILETKPKTNYIAYCFKKVNWRKAVEIIATTKGVDWPFFKWAVYRGHFTLRVTPKCGRQPKLAWILKSSAKEDCFIYDLKSWVQYETLEDGTELKVKELKI